MDQAAGFVFVRGGSKGVPRKNLRKLNGKSLLGRAIQSALSADSIDRVYVSTDCQELAKEARSHGALVPFLRPAELATDAAPERLAWRHAIEQVEQFEGKRLEQFVSIPAVCPLRISSDIDRCIDKLSQSDADIVVTVTNSESNPSFNLLSIDETGTAELLAGNKGQVCRRQDAPEIFKLVAVAYAARRDSIFKFDTIFDGRVQSIFVPPERAVDIDTELDLAFADFLLTRQSEAAYRRVA